MKTQKNVGGNFIGAHVKCPKSDKSDKRHFANPAAGDTFRCTKCGETGHSVIKLLPR